MWLAGVQERPCYRIFPKMVKMTEAVIKSTHLPVTVKTRLGWDNDTRNVPEVAERLQDIGIAALTIHGRTRVQMYKGEADWTLIGEIKRNPRIHIPIFGNGDIDSPEKAMAYRKQYNVDGVMIGRASIGYPWIFRRSNIIWLQAKSWLRLP
jgi:tRNA-dihydrouridine synthase B